MKLSRSKAMRKLLSRGLKMAKKTKTPTEGYSTSLIYETLKNGWHYQVNYTRDQRVLKKYPFVTVYAFRPPLNFTARDADLYIHQALL